MGNEAPLKKPDFYFWIHFSQKQPKGSPDRSFAFLRALDCADKFEELILLCHLTMPGTLRRETVLEHMLRVAKTMPELRFIWSQCTSGSEIEVRVLRKIVRLINDPNTLLGLASHVIPGTKSSQVIGSRFDALQGHAVSA